MGRVSLLNDIPLDSPEYQAASEHLHQSAFCEIMDTKYRGYHDLFYTIPNGGGRSKVEAINLNKEGLKRGMPDTHLPFGTFWDLDLEGVFTFPFPPEHGNYKVRYMSLYLEFKDMDKRSQPKPHQVEKIERLRVYGHAAFVVHGWRQAWDCWLWYLGQANPVDILHSSGLNLAAQLEGKYDFDSWRKF